jgi:3-oxoacyl-[acyl-carrier protein] reductase
VSALEGRAALVTGSARGMGAAIAERLAGEGAAVAVNYSTSAVEAEAVAERIRAAGGTARVIQADVGDPAQVRALVEEAVSGLGRLDILVNNAGTATFAPIEAIEDGQVRSQFAVNVEGPMFATQAAPPHFPPDGGRVINITGLVQLHPVPGASVYAAAKGAIDALTRVWAMELGPRGVTVNAVAPGPVETDGFAAASTEELRTLFVSRTPWAAWAGHRTSPKWSRSWPHRRRAGSPDTSCSPPAGSPVKVHLTQPQRQRRHDLTTWRCAELHRCDHLRSPTRAGVPGAGEPPRHRRLVDNRCERLRRPGGQLQLEFGPDSATLRVDRADPPAAMVWTCLGTPGSRSGGTQRSGST